MPDLITHVALSHLVIRPFDLRASNPEQFSIRILFYLGTVLPDLLTRPWYILFPVTKDWTLVFHTPLGMLITSGCIALLFTPRLRKSAFLNLIGGGSLHFLLDSLQKQIYGNNFWLFPLSYKNFEIGIAWAEDFLNLIPLWILLIALLESGQWIMRRKTKRKKS